MVLQILKNKFNVRIFDTKTELCTNSFEDTVNFSDIIFISVLLQAI